MNPKTTIRKTGAEIITALLERQGIDTVPGIPGGATLPLYDALRNSAIRHVLARHEQGAGFIAQGMARVTGKAAVCTATSGPGATNLLTAIADAKLDSVPLVAITGQVSTDLLGTDAFQEIDTYGLTVPISKHNFLVRDANELLEIIPRAFEIAESGRPGPVVVDVPKDVQTREVSFERWPEPRARLAPPPVDVRVIERLSALIHEARRPILYIGGGVIAAEADQPLMSLARKNAIPVACSLAGLGAFPADDPLYLGMLGMHGARYTNYVLEEADLLLAIGVRFDDRATGKVAQFCPRARIVHVDIDRSEIDKLKPSYFAVVGDAGQVLQALNPFVQPDLRLDWTRRVADLKARFPLEKPVAKTGLCPYALIERLSGMLDPETVITTDVGQHQMWVAQAYPFRRPRRLLTSGGLGTMGFGLPAAIGAALATAGRSAQPSASALRREKEGAARGRRVVCISGDGSIMMNIQELATLADLDLDVTVIIMNNHHLGLVRQQQQMFYGARYIASRFDRPTDFAAVARSFGIRGFDASPAEDITATLANAFSRPGPSVVNVPIAEAENVLPMVPPGAANREMIGKEQSHAEYSY
jgi:acetolactate synthase I/II/III large subunit